MNSGAPPIPTKKFSRRSDLGYVKVCTSLIITEEVLRLLLFLLSLPNTIIRRLGTQLVFPVLTLSDVAPVVEPLEAHTSPLEPVAEVPVAKAEDVPPHAEAQAPITPEGPNGSGDIHPEKKPRSKSHAKPPPAIPQKKKEKIAPPPPTDEGQGQSKATTQVQGYVHIAVLRTH